MIIRNQIKDVITTDLNLWIENRINNYVICNKEFNLGWYSTEEKAIKVLDMICRAYEHFRGGNVYEHSIFQMPQDSEV